MKELFKITEFSYRTGLSASALRFYEEKSLLIPDRLPNGYRVYQEHQVETARLVVSLREAGITIEEIRRFLSASPEVQKEWLEAWRIEAEAHVLHLQISMQFLNGLSLNANRIHLIRWNRPTYMVWKRIEFSKPPSSFHPILEEHHARLATMGGNVGQDGYVRTLSVTNEFVVELGFPLRHSDSGLTGMTERFATGERIETMPPTLFVSVGCAVDDPYVCLQITRFVAQFGYVPVGSRLDKYLLNDDTVEVMIPVKRQTEIWRRPY